MNEIAGSTIKFKGNVYTAAISAAKFSYQLNNDGIFSFKETLRAFFTRKVSIPSSTKEQFYLVRANKLISEYEEKKINFRIITKQGFDKVEKRGLAQDYVDQCIIRTWPYNSISHPGHAALSVKSGEGEEQSHSYVSWWASEESLSGMANTKTGTKGELFNKVYGYSQINYLQDKYCEMSDRARSKLAAAKNALEKVKKGHFSKEDLRNASFELRERQKALPKWGDDAFGVSADKVYIPPQGVNRNKKSGALIYNFFGLDRESMEKDWVKIQKQEMDGVATYRMISNKKNCAGMVLRVLRKGRANIYISERKLSGIVNTSNNIHRYAVQLQLRIDELNDMAGRLIANFNCLDEDEKEKMTRKLPMLGHTAMHIADKANSKSDFAYRAIYKRISTFLYRIDKAEGKWEIVSHSVKLLGLIKKLNLEKENDDSKIFLEYSLYQIMNLLKKFECSKARALK